MILPDISRRQLLCSLLPGLAAWLCPRPSCTAATTLSKPADAPQHHPTAYFTEYTYDRDASFVTPFSYRDDASLVITYSYDANGNRNDGKK